MKKYLVLDTNILLLDANNLTTLGKDYTIVLPETVLDEIDSKKSGTSEIAFQARAFGRLLTKATVVEAQQDNVITIIQLSLDDVDIIIASLVDYPDTSDTELNIRNDRKILAVASYINDLFNDVTFMSNDVMCRMRAISYNLTTVDLKTVEQSDQTFTKTMNVDIELFSRLHNLSIIEVDPDYKIQNYNYLFTSTEFTTQVKLGNVRNGLIDILGKETEAELARQDVAPMNAGQKFLSRAIQNRNIDIVICEALAGSGKTVTAFSNAIRMIKKGEYGGIIYIRVSVDDVPKEEEIGFLSGNDEKIAPYLHPLDDTLDFIARSRNKSPKVRGKEYEEKIAMVIEEMKERYNIRGMIGLGMRGRTFDNDVVIIDEAQNMSKASMQKVLTRFGKNCKIIIIGSNKQIDNSYITKYTNGLSTLLEAATKEFEGVKLYAVTLDKVLRSNIAEFAENIFSKKGNSQ